MTLSSSHGRQKFALPIFLSALSIGLSVVHATAPASPSILKPVSGSTNLSTSVTLGWGASTGANRYRYQFSTSSKFSTLIYNTTTRGTSTNLYGLFNGQKYYWRVQAINTSNETSPWATANFTPRPALTTNGNGGRTDVGMWYIPWGGIGTNWGDTIGYLPLIDANGTYGRYEISDDAIMTFHFNEIANAKIDFVIYDNTNGGFMDPLPTGGYPPPPPPGVYNTEYNTNSQTAGYVATSGQMCKKIKSWNDTHSWKLRYVQAIGAANFKNGLCLGGPETFNDCVEEQAKRVWNNFVQNPDYGGSSNYYYLDGKPLLILWGGIYSEQIQHWYNFTKSASFTSFYANKFTVRFALQGEKGTYGWNIWGGGDTHAQYGSGTVIDNEVELVSPGWYRDDNAAQEIPRDNGLFYRINSWERVFSHKRPRIVSIVAFNDYWEHTAVWTAKADPTCAPPQCAPWTDESGVENPGMYWSMTKSYIARLRGIAPNTW